MTLSSGWRVAWLMACCVVLGIGAAYLYWPKPPHRLNEFQLEQMELARQREDVAKRAAQALPHVLPNEAPAAVLANGPAGKALPVRLTWQDVRGDSGGVAEELDGCIAAGPGIDALWHRGDLFLMKQKGLLRRVRTAGRIDSPYGPMHRGSFVSVCYDGKFVWAPLLGFSQPQIVVLDPQSEQTWQIGAEDQPREPADDTPRQHGGGFAAAPWAPGKVVVSGWPGVTWLAMIGFDPEKGKSVEPLPPPVDLEQNRAELLPSDQTRLAAYGMWTVSEPPANGEEPIRRLFIDRTDPSRPGLSALAVDPTTSRFEKAGGASLTEARGCTAWRSATARCIGSSTRPPRNRRPSWCAPNFPISPSKSRWLAFPTAIRPFTRDGCGH